MNRLSGKVAVITGGNAGIGEAIAMVFAREGASVVITGRRKGELDRVASEIMKEQGKAYAVAGSVTDESHVQEVARRTVQQFGRLDILVNNAGIGDFGKRLHESDDATWAQVLDVNLTGVFRMTRAVLPQMLKQGKGAIVNISSIASLVGLPTLPAYAASKGALDALTRALAIDYAKEGIRCNVVNPGLIDTPMAASLMSNSEQLGAILSHYPIRRAGKPGEVANLVLYLVSDEAAWVTGGTFPIDGGMTIS
jgi:NAD(P)-dependent dehydrogenase (short-subunit alcohol dehydrogenase family)